MPPDASPLLHAAGVDAGYGTMQVLWGVDLDVRAGYPAHVQMLIDGSNSTTALQAQIGRAHV